MPLTRIAADALSVVTISVVALLVLLGLFCLLYSFYFRAHIRGRGLVRLSYFGGPWIIRITFILIFIWWCCCEIVRLNLLRHKGLVLHDLNLKWQETVCKGYIVLNLGFAEPCLFLTIVFLLRASFQKTEAGPLSRNWNLKTACFILLCCAPLLILQVLTVLVGPKLNKSESGGMQKLPLYFTRTSIASSKTKKNLIFCTYPLLSTIFLGIFYASLTTYLFWLGRRILKLVINKGLRKRVYTLILSVSTLFPLRVVFLGLSVLVTPGKHYFWFEALPFLAFLSLACCAPVVICTLIYLPISDALALRNVVDTEARRRISDENDDTASLIANEMPPEAADVGSPERASIASTKRGSISFRTMQKDEHSGAFVELSLFSPSQNSSPTGSPRLGGWPMHSSAP